MICSALGFGASLGPPHAVSMATANQPETLRLGLLIWPAKWGNPGLPF